MCDILTDRILPTWNKAICNYFYVLRITNLSPHIVHARTHLHIQSAQQTPGFWIILDLLQLHIRTLQRNNRTDYCYFVRCCNRRLFLDLTQFWIYISYDTTTNVNGFSRPSSSSSSIFFSFNVSYKTAANNVQ